MNNAIERFPGKHCYGEIYPDDNPNPPFESIKGYCELVCWHRNYNLGTQNGREFGTGADFLEWFRKEGGGVILPLYLYDHSGITISTTPFSCPWDSGQVGHIYATKKMLRKHFGVKNITRYIREKAISFMYCVVKEYDRYLTGDVYGYKIIRNDDGEELSSCWGFYGRKHVDEEVKSLVQWYDDDAEKKLEIKNEIVGIA